MGIEPTDHMISMRPDSFEDYGLHQQYKHFLRSWLPTTPTSIAIKQPRMNFTVLDNYI